MFKRAHVLRAGKILRVSGFVRYFGFGDVDDVLSTLCLDGRCFLMHAHADK